MSSNNLEREVLRDVLSLLAEYQEKYGVADFIYKRVEVSGRVISSGGGMRVVPNPGMKGAADIEIRWVSRKRIIHWELKKPKGGVQSPHQKFFEHKVKKKGEEYYLVTSVEQGRGILDGYL